MSGVAAAIGIGGSLLSSGINYFQGRAQKKQGEELAKANPFRAERMPSEVTQATQLAQQNYTNGMPGMQYAKQGIQQNAGNAYAAASKGASSGGDLLDVAGKIQTNANDANQQLALQAASYKSNALGGYEAALGNQAQWQDKLYQNNELQPYLRAANTAAALQGAGSINEANAIQSGVQGIQAGAMEFGNMKYQNQLMKQGTTMGDWNGHPDLADPMMASSIGGAPGLVNGKYALGGRWTPSWAQPSPVGLDTNKLIAQSQFLRDGEWQ